MSISHIDSTSARATTTGTVTVTAPTGIADNDLLLAWYLHTDNDAAPVTLSGFTQIESGIEDANGQDTTTAFFRKIAATESGNYALTGDSPPTPLTSNGVVTCLRGIDTTTPLDVTYVLATHYLKQVDVAGVTNKAITTATDNAWVVLFIWVGESAATDFTAPSGYTKIEQLIGGGSNMAVAYKLVSTASTETPGAWTVTNVGSTEEIVMVTLAIRPATTTDGAAMYHHLQTLGAY